MTARAPQHVEIPHPGKVLFTGVGLTKAGLAAYYEAVAGRGRHPGGVGRAG